MVLRRGNGDGSIFKLSGRRRRPYAVRVTIGWTDEGKQKYKYVGYFKNKTTAKHALNKYLSDPSEKIIENITLKQVYENAMKSGKYSDGTIKQYNAYFNKLELLHNKPINKITLAELENLLQDKTPSVQGHIKRVITTCFNHALKHDYVKKNLSEFIHVETAAPDAKRTKTPFTASEINKLWETLGTKQNDDMALILLYTGMRIGELLAIENENVNLQEKYIDIKKSKTTAGFRRLPIHEKILPLIAARYDKNRKYLIVNKYGRQMSYMSYFQWFWYNAPHTIHETRHTFITGLNKAGIDELTIKRIVGHANKDVTENYTHRTQKELLDAVNKLEYK